MLKLGLTGGIASGKSVVAAILRELGFPVLDADSISHKLMEPGQTAHNEILQSFGADLADSSGNIDRHKLASIVFADLARLAQLNSILHPRVDQIIFRQLEDWQKSGAHPAAFVEAALLIEAGMAARLDGLVVAWCTPEQQLERLRARGMAETEARRRIAAQLPIEEKRKHATYTIDCSGTLEETRAQVQALAANLHKRQST
jgi:dephospho-CoA kinase